MDSLPVLFDCFNIKSFVDIKCEVLKYRYYVIRSQMFFFLLCLWINEMLSIRQIKSFLFFRMTSCEAVCPVLCRWPFAFSNFIMWLDWLICCLLSCPYFFLQGNAGCLYLEAFAAVVPCNTDGLVCLTQRSFVLSTFCSTISIIPPFLG